MRKSKITGKVYNCGVEEGLWRDLKSGQYLAQAQVNNGDKYLISNETRDYKSHQGTLTLHPEGDISTVLKRCIAQPKGIGLTMPIDENLTYRREGITRKNVLYSGTEKVHLSLYLTEGKRTFSHFGYTYSHSDYQSYLKFSCPTEKLYNCLLIGFLLFNGFSDQDND